MRFVADSMLGKLARHLRIMGYDTLYHTGYSPEELAGLVREGRTLLTRNRSTAQLHSPCVFLWSDLVKDQLEELDRATALERNRKNWFSRCLVCNELLVRAEAETARESVPDFVFSRYSERIQYCPGCKRFYWPGTHKERMLEKLSEWGF